MIQETDQKKEPNAWLGRVGWATHLNGIDPQLLHQSIQPPDSRRIRYTAWGMLASNGSSISLYYSAVPGNVARSVLFEIGKRTRYTRTTLSHITAKLEPETQTQYKRYMQQVICFIVRSQGWNDELVRYKLTPHARAINRAIRSRSGRNIDRYGLIPESEVQLDRTCLDFIISMLDHQLDSDYDSGLSQCISCDGCHRRWGLDDSNQLHPHLFRNHKGH